jgi:hypothetical protein
MCDYSLQAVKSRPAKVADKLVTRNFGTGTTGFAAVDDHGTAVCVLPGTELAFDVPVQLRCGFMNRVVDTLLSESTPSYKTAIFRQVNKDVQRCHHDVLEFPDGEHIMLTYMSPGVCATVLQLPAAPRTDAEREEQTRAEYVG